MVDGKVMKSVVKTMPKKNNENFKIVRGEKHKNCYCCTFEYGSDGTNKEVGKYEYWFEGRKSFIPKISDTIIFY